VAAASIGVLANWRFSHWLKCPTTKTLLLAALGLGLAELVKTSWIILFALWPAMWGVWRLANRNAEVPKPGVMGLTAIILVAIYMLNLGYKFENTCARLDSFTFISETLGGKDAHKVGGNRFDGSLAGGIRVPFPANYIRGIDVQKFDFEEEKYSLLRGEQKKGGWWYYYIYALLVKTPLGIIAIFAVALVLFCSNADYRARFSDEVILIIPGAALFILVSSQTGFNRYIRYVIPALPYLYIACSRVGLALLFGHKSIARFCFAGLAVGISSSIAVFPYSLSYFNIGVGGPMNGKWHLVDGNIDWGQDLYELKSWLDSHPEVEPVGVQYFGCMDLDSVGIIARQVPSPAGFALPGERVAPVCGWYAISVNRLMGYREAEYDEPRFTYFQSIEPVATIGYSIYVFQIEEEDLPTVQSYLDREGGRLFHPD